MDVCAVVLCVVRFICRTDHSSIEVLLNVCDGEVLIIVDPGPLGAVEL
jgi:hypothetical protein